MTASNLFSSTINSETTFSFFISNFIAPPTSQPIDAIIVTSYSTASATGAIDNCSAYVTNLQPKIISSTLFFITDQNDQQMYVNSINTIKFTITIIDIISQANDYFIITFPKGLNIDLTNTQIGGSIDINSLNPTFINNNLTLRMTGSGTLTPQQIFITLTNFVAPPSTKTTDNFTFYVLQNGYPKMVSYKTITTLPNNLEGAVAVANTKVNAITTYTFKIAISDPLSSSGKITITFPSTIVLASISSTCAVITGTNFNPTPQCTTNSVANIVTLSSLNSSTNNIGAQTFKVVVSNVQNPGSTTTTSSFTIATYYQ